LGASLLMPVGSGPGDTSEVCTTADGIINCVDVSSGSDGLYLWPILVVVVLVVAPLAMAVHLYHAAGRRAANA